MSLSIYEEQQMQPALMFFFFCHIQAKAALQAKANAETNAQLAAIVQQQKDINKAVQDQQQQVQAAQRSVEDLQRQKDHRKAELQTLLSHVPELSDMMTR